MSFVSPFFLYGLFALAIPVIIHLINFRRYKKVWFTNVRFLSEIKQERQRRSQLRQWILLAIRLLAITSLVIAFAQPYLPSSLRSDKQQQQGVCIFVDNSFSMDAIGNGGKLIETAKEKAREVASAYKPSDKFQLLTNDFEGVHQHFVSRDEFLKLLQEVRISPASRKLSDVVGREKDLLDANPGLARNIFLISDFQEATSDFNQLEPDTITSYFIIPLTANQTGNLYIDTVFFESVVQQPDQLSFLHVRVKNTGSSRLEKIPVKLVINSRQKALASAEADPGSETELILPFTNESGGIQSGYIEIPDYPIVYDDKCYFSYPLITTISVLSINGAEENPYLNALLGTDSIFRFVNASVNHLNYSSFSSFSLIILNQVHPISSGLAQELNRFVVNGGSLLTILPKDLEPSQYKEMMTLPGIPEIENADTGRLRVSNVMVESQVYQDVFEPNSLGQIELPGNADLPVVNYHYPIKLTTTSNLEPLLILQNGDILLCRKPFGKGKIYLLTTPLDLTCSSFPAHLLFVPTLYKIALLSQPGSNLYYFTATNDPIEVPSDTLQGEQIFKILKDDASIEIIPEMRFVDGRMLLYPYDQVREAGLYSILFEDKPLSGLAFNYPRTESDLHCIHSESIHEILEQKEIRSAILLPAGSPSMAKEIREAEQGKPLWKLFLLLALLFLGAEIALIRFFPKH
ncbi:MAG: BatA and WFA domain-containing protein [Bacteroidales bacterium]|nr:BatA and WFA domain-containing protein [Bacteroidales bacterium]